MSKDRKVVVVMPAYNAELTLKKTYEDLPLDAIDEVLLVDDASPDRTVHLARELGIRVIEHPENRGYGANQKTCYDAALDAGGDVIVLLHPDYQYDPTMVMDLVAPILEGEADFTFGSRFRSSWRDPLRGGMPLYRWVGNRLTTFIENLLMRTNFAELHSGYKAYSRRFLQSIPYHDFSNQFVFDSQMIIMAAVSRQFKIREVAIPTRYAEDSSSVGIRKSLTYIGLTIWYLLEMLVRRRRIREQIKSRLAQLSST
jgi:glycosyltransferase involved in cell wall biosynthesis